MRLSKKFRLAATQAELDFVDIDTTKDTPLFLDSYLLGRAKDPWAMDVSRTIDSFFSFFLSLLYSGEKALARELFDYLHEPNETCLGMSRKRPMGRGVGEGDAQRIFDSLADSEAAKTGLLQKLEDCRIFVKGIDKDKASDMTTNIVRSHLIDYTVNQCRLWDIPLVANSPSGDCWNGTSREWESGFASNLIVEGKRILLVPKSSVSYCKRYTSTRFRQHFLLNFLQHEHLRLGTHLVQERRTKREIKRFVTKKSIIKEGLAPTDKDFYARFTKAHPLVFADFKSNASTKEDSIALEDLVSEELSAICKHLAGRLAETPYGPEHATQYHRLVVSILELLCYPQLSKPSIEVEIHDGRKRIDISFDNSASGGFFAALSNQARLPSRYIYAECKNYGRDVGNPEIDQLSGRFSPNSGKVGLLLCRAVANFDALILRCRDTLSDDRGLILPLVDEDLIDALNKFTQTERNPLEERLEDLQRLIALRRQ